MRKIFVALSAMLLCGSMGAAESITGWDITYREMCLKAATDPWYFQNFRSLSDYAHALEIGKGGEFADLLLKTASQKTMSKLPALQHLEEFGNPPTSYYPGVGTFSGTTLRYIVIADQIGRLFSLPDDAKIAEIGAGFGGQSYVISQLQTCSNYYIYDLPEVEALIEKMAEALPIDNVVCLPLDTPLPEESIDLVISNYAFSECGRETQLEYIEKVILKSKRGYLIYNQIAERVYGLDYLTPVEFINLLKNNGIHAKVYSEPVMTDVDNLLIVWDNS
jgi:hypothetical protein